MTGEDSGRRMASAGNGHRARRDNAASRDGRRIYYQPNMADALDWQRRWACAKMRKKCTTEERLSRMAHECAERKRYIYQPNADDALNWSGA